MKESVKTDAGFKTYTTIIIRYRDNGLLHNSCSRLKFFRLILNSIANGGENN